MEKIQQYIANSDQLGRHEADELEILLEKFPYFQTLHILLAKCHKNQGTFGFNKNLKLASLYAGDRKILYNFINFERHSGSKNIASETQVKEVFHSENEGKNIGQPVDSELNPIDSIGYETIVEKASADSVDSIIQTAIPEDNTNVLQSEILNNTITGDEIIEEVEQDKQLQETIAQKKSVFEVVIKEKKPLPAEITGNDKSEITVFNTTPQTETLTDEILTDSNEEKTESAENVFNEESSSDNVSEIITDSDQNEESVAAIDLHIENTGDEVIHEIQVTPEQSGLPEELIDSELNAETEAIKDDSANAVIKEKEKGAVETEIEALEFSSWLDAFSIDSNSETKTEEASASVNNKSEQTEEKVSETKPGEVQAEVKLPLFSNESDESKDEYNPAAWAEIAYEIQAFVKQPEEGEDKKSEPVPISKTEIDELLDRFIKKNPSISRTRAEFYKPENMARKSEEFHGEVASETLAQLFYKQGYLHKALEIYEKLILQNPEKKANFATRIKSIKEELINRL